MRIILLLIFVVGLVASYPAAAQGRADFDFSDFSVLPVLHEGRMKPLASFARSSLHYYADGEADRPAILWLADTLFTPKLAVHYKIFRIENDSLKRLLNLPEGRQEFSWLELQPPLQNTKARLPGILQKTEDDITGMEERLLNLHDRHAGYGELLRSLSLVLPLANETASQSDPLKYIDFINNGERPEEWQNAFRAIELAGEGNKALRVLPPLNDREEWLSPWQSVQAANVNARHKVYLNIWASLAAAYRGGDTKEWRENASRLKNMIYEEQAVSRNLPERLRLETFYQSIPVYPAIIFMFGLSFLFFLFKINLAGWAFYAAGTVSLALAIAARSFILLRPPVGTLYESVLFVALVCAVAALTGGMRSQHQKELITMSGSFAAALLLAMAPYLIEGRDGLDVLVAVLNSGFWLTTHVLVITAGYALCILAALCAHAGLFMRGQHRPAIDPQRIHAITCRLSMWALLFTAVGTFLGGIWADQSWGRFWGWDPKENGALLIVLWLIWVQHGLRGGKLSETGADVLFAMLNVIVALAWFGVNLLNVGLHSYGFVSGVMTALSSFVIFQLIIIAALYWRIYMRQLREAR